MGNPLQAGDAEPHKGGEPASRTPCRNRVSLLMRCGEMAGLLN